MFDEICKKIISPPKFRYSLYDLGATVTKYGKRTDFQIHNHKNLKMNCSLYEPNQIQFQRACVVYLHSMNGSRLQGSVYMERILKEGVSYCTFDFSGCGNSDGDKISFGANEKHDIEALINKLKETFYLNRFILWGRSMGSVSAIKYSELIYDKSRTVLSCQNEEIVALVLDSSFKSFSKLLVEIGHTQSEIPKFIIQAGIFIIKNTLERNGQFKISELDLVSDSGSSSTQEKYPLQKLQNLNLPILFLASKEDKTVSYEHSMDMFYAYKSKNKELKFFKGLHNQSRQEDYIYEVVSFIRKVLKTERNSQALISEQLTTLNSQKELSQSGTIPKPFSSENQIKGKNSVLKLIEQHSTNQQGSTLFEFQNIQKTCVCTMFDNEIVKHEEEQPYRQRQRYSNFKEAQPLQQNHRENFSCDQALPKTYQNHTKVKKSIAEFSNSSHHKLLEYHGPNFSKANLTSSYFVEPIISPKSFKKIRQSVELKQKKIEENNEVGRLTKGEHKIFDELYTPLRVSSERTLRSNSSLKDQ